MLSLLLLKELRPGSGASADSGSPMDSVRFHKPSLVDKTACSARLLLISWLWTCRCLSEERLGLSSLSRGRKVLSEDRTGSITHAALPAIGRTGFFLVRHLGDQAFGCRLINPSESLKHRTCHTFDPGANALMASGFALIRQFQMSRERGNALAICTDAAANIMRFAHTTCSRRPYPIRRSCTMTYRG